MRSGAAIYKDPSAAVEARVEDLLARMTLEEKIAQITSVWESKVGILDKKFQLDPAKLKRLYPNGIGQFSRPLELLEIESAVLKISYVRERCGSTGAYHIDTITETNGANTTGVKNSPGLGVSPGEQS